MSIQVGGIEDHVHLLLAGSADSAPCKIAKLVKGGSSASIHDTFPTLHGFAWQDGYGAFTVSKSALADVTDYIRGQRQHHQTRTFQDEYRAFLRKHDVEIDERYLWD